MTWADELLNEQNTEASKLTEILQSNYADFDYIVAVEGSDDVEFYNDFLEDLLGKNFLPFPCDNKIGVENLKRACSSYQWEAEPKIFYICDQDFDGYLDKLEHGIYYTDHYSIESEISKATVVEYVIRRGVTPRPSSKQLAAITAKFESELARCAINLKPLACLMIEARSRNLHPDFDQHAFNDFFHVHNDSITVRPIDTAALLASWNIDDVNFPATSQRWSGVLADVDFKNWTRGKYLLQIAKKCLELSLKPQFPGASKKCAAQMGRDAFRFIKLAVTEIPSLTAALTPAA
ncbi:DUF4435 domain-containing protein [Rhizobium leguminosarum bv. viciae]|nr:DUF4435 domain-containing protein [Rhizobium leguminosarum bv. viciae]